MTKNWTAPKSTLADHVSPLMGPNDADGPYESLYSGLAMDAADNPKYEHDIELCSTWLRCGSSRSEINIGMSKRTEAKIMMISSE